MGSNLAALAEAKAASRPQIIVSGQFMRDITAEALDVIEKANAKTPTMFRLGGAWVRVREGATQSDPITQAALKGWLDRHADFMKQEFDEQGEPKEPKPARPPGDVIQDLLALPEAPLPKLNGVATAPVFLPGGELLAEEGYHAESGLLLRLGQLGNLEADMTLDEAKQWLLVELMGDFPFLDQASRAHALALLLERFVRPLIDGLSPLHLIDAPIRGSGKGLLADVVALLASGAFARVMRPARDDDETEKRVTATLLASAPVILLDNVTQIRSESLAAVLTASVWRGRRLGKSELVEVPNHSLWIATANNPELSDENARRAVSIRLDPEMERPEEREDFRHEYLKEWTLENRPQLVRACLSLVGHWIRSGMPEGQERLGSFERWSAVMGGILGMAGVPGLLTDRDRLYAGADRESSEWQATCKAWWEAFGGEAVAAAELLAVLREHDLLLGLWGGRSHLGGLQRLGRALAARRDRVFGMYVIRAAGQDGRTRSNSSRLEKRGAKKTPETPETPSREAETPMQTAFKQPALRRGFGGVSSQNPDKTPQNPDKTPKNPEVGKPPLEQVSENGAGVSGFSGVLNGPQSQDDDEDAPY